MSVSRKELADRLRSRRSEIEQALLARTGSVADAPLSDDPEYRAGFRAAVAAAVDYSFSVVALDEGEVPPPVPAEILNQSRLAARHLVELDAVIRRYIAGSHLLDSFILEEADPPDWEPVQRSRAAALELLLREVGAEYKRAQERRSTTREAKRLRCVQGLLKGEPANKSRLEYDLDLHHVAVVTQGEDAEHSLRQLAKLLDSRLLLVRPEEGISWAWIGRLGAIATVDVQRAVESAPISDLAVGIGESASGIAGWRQSHRQARASLPVALGRSNRFARYCDVCLVASAMQDDLLASSLREMYLRPLWVGKDRGATLLRTLRAYFAAHRNSNSTASALGISRQAVARRLQVVEERIGQSLPCCASAMEMALDLAETEPGHLRLLAPRVGSTQGH